MNRCRIQSELASQSPGEDRPPVISVGREADAIPRRAGPRHGTRRGSIFANREVGMLTRYLGMTMNQGVQFLMKPLKALLNIAIVNMVPNSTPEAIDITQVMPI